MKTKSFLTSLFFVLVLTAAGRPADADALTYKSGDPTPTIKCAELRHCIIRFPEGVEFMEYIISDPPSWIVDAGTFGKDLRHFIAARPRACGTSTLLSVPTNEDLFQVVLASEPCDGKGPGIGDDLRVVRSEMATAIKLRQVQEAKANREVAERRKAMMAEPTPQFLNEPLEIAKTSRRLRKMGINVVRSKSRTYLIFTNVDHGIPAVAQKGAGGKLQSVGNTRFVVNRLEIDKRLDRGYVIFAGKKKMRFRF